MVGLLIEMEMLTSGLIFKYDVFLTFFLPAAGGEGAAERRM